jgi:hypothetical protein
LEKEGVQAGEESAGKEGGGVSDKKGSTEQAGEEGDLEKEGVQAGEESAGKEGGGVSDKDDTSK